jgi:prepilin-type N-terminal cleavage/methylation domain-containing protein
MKYRGLSLIELLVVVAIIAILAALLFPAFTEARRQGWRMQCVGNLRQIGTAVNQYLQDWEDTLPWAYQLDAVSSRGMRPTLPDVLESYTRSRDIWRCPSDVGEIWPDGPFGHHKETPPFYIVNTTSYSYLGIGWSPQREILAGRPTSQLRHPTLTPLSWETRPWHGHNKRDDYLWTSPALWNVLYVDGHIARETHRQFRDNLMRAMPRERVVPL